MIPGDGVGPDLMKSVKDVFKAAEVPVQFDEINFSEIQNKNDSATFDKVVESIQRNGIGIMGKIQAGEADRRAGPMSTAFALRHHLNMYANVCHVKSLEGLQSRHNNVDCVVIREQMEGEYKAMEHEPIPGVVEALKITTRENSERICKVW